MAEWNKAYGRSAHLTDRGGDYSLGSYIEKLNSKAVCPSEFLTRGSKRYVIDAVIYNRAELCDLVLSTYNDAQKEPEKFVNDSNSIHPENMSDEELLTELIEQNGEDILSKVNGDFAGAVYDADANTLTMFRDHMGIRPLYYYVSNEFVCFSTDLRGILAVENTDTTINDAWVYRTYLHLIEYTSTSTEYKYIYCVRPASSIKIEFKSKAVRNRYPSRTFHAREYDYEVDDSQRNYWRTLTRVRINEKKYWHLGERKIRYKTEEEYSARLRELIEDSVALRLDAFDGIAAAEFSGGLDSSLISILIKKMGRDCLYCSWSNDPKDQPLTDPDERRTILEICERYSIKCDFLGKRTDFNKFTRFNENYSEVTEADCAEGALEKYAFWPMLGTFHLLNSAAYVADRGGKVIFTGHGGDEGVSHRPNPYELIYHNEIKNYIDYYSNVRKCKNFKKLRGMVRASRAFVQQKKAILRKLPQKVASAEYGESNWQIIDPEFLKRGKSLKDIPFTFGYDVVKYILRNGSRARMDCVAVYGAYSGVRYMFPYLDHRVIDFAVSIERGMYLRHGTNRYILKNAFRDLLPDSLLGDVNKFDPSFAKVHSDPVSLERRIQVIKRRMVEYRDKYHCDKVDGIFLLKDIIREIDSKEITEKNIDELTGKCETVLNTFRLQILVEKARKRST